MTRDREYPVSSPDKIDWSESSLGSLLQESTGWQLDRRNNFAVQEVRVTRDRGTDAYKLGNLVWESEGEMVVATDAPCLWASSCVSTSRSGIVSNLSGPWSSNARWNSATPMRLPSLICNGCAQIWRLNFACRE